MITLDIGVDTPLEQALIDLVQKAGMQLSSTSLAGFKTRRLKGTFTVGRAVTELLRDSGLTFQIEGNMLYVSPALVDPVVTKGSGSDHSGLTDPGGSLAVRKANARRHRKSETPDDSDGEMSLVNVRGHIPDSPLTTPRFSFDRDYLEAGGFQTVGDFLRSLPQSFGGGLNLGTISAGGSQNTTSQSAASTANLRGLGSSSTLTLLDGHRFATAEGSGALDVTLIPISAVQRIEVTTGGASANFGSDAVAGTVNIVLRDDYQGLEITGVVGGATGGGDFLQHDSIVAGHAWDDANVFAVEDCAWQQAILAGQRNYVPTSIAGTTLMPTTRHCSTLFRGSRDLPDGIEANALGIYTKRAVLEAENFGAFSSGLAESTHADVSQYAVSASLSVPFFDTWTAVGSASLSADDVNSPESLTTAGLPYMSEANRFDNRLWSVEAGAVGIVGESWAGPVQLALGAGYDAESFGFTSIPDTGGDISRQRDDRFVFVEGTLPLIASGTAAKGPPVLKLDVAVRSEQYSDVGTTTNPALALTYTPSSSYRVSASWGTSFRAPTLLQEYGISQVTLEPVADPAAASGQSLALFRFGGNPRLTAEESSNTSLDATFNPATLPGMSLQLGYYNILYRKRIEYPTPDTGDPLSDRDVWPFVTRNPSAADITQVLAQSQFVDKTDGQYLPTEATVIIDDRNQNISQQHASGVDFLAKYQVEPAIGRLDSSLNLAWLDLRQRVTTASSVLPLSGTVFYPPTWRGRSGLTWSRGNYLGSVFLNFTGGSRNIESVPPQPVASWTTVDLQMGRMIHGDGHRPNIKMTLSAQNLFDRPPPHVSTTQTGSATVNYDSTNSSPVGLFLAFEVRMVW